MISIGILTVHSFKQQHSAPMPQKEEQQPYNTATRCLITTQRLKCSSPTFQCMARYRPDPYISHLSPQCFASHFLCQPIIAPTLLAARPEQNTNTCAAPSLSHHRHTDPTPSKYSPLSPCKCPPLCFTKKGVRHCLCWCYPLAPVTVHLCRGIYQQSPTTTVIFSNKTPCQQASSPFSPISSALHITPPHRPYAHTAAN